MDAWGQHEGRHGEAEMPSDDVEIRDEVRAAEESPDDAERQAHESTRQGREPLSGPGHDDGDDESMEVSEAATEPPRDLNA